MKILIVEDHKLVRDMFAASCRGVVPKAAILVAGNGADGVRTCRLEHPDLIFLDLVLPDGDGLDLVPELRAATPG